MQRSKKLIIEGTSKDMVALHLQPQVPGPHTLTKKGRKDWQLEKLEKNGHSLMGNSSAMKLQLPVQKKVWCIILINSLLQHI